MNYAKFNKLEKFEPEWRDNFDRRRMYASAVFSYLAANGDEYRRRYKAPIGSTIEQLEALAPAEIKIMDV